LIQSWMDLPTTARGLQTQQPAVCFSVRKVTWALFGVPDVRNTPPLIDAISAKG
jgi:hypothetical protein